MVKHIVPATLALSLGIAGALAAPARIEAKLLAQAAPIQSTATEQAQLKKEEDANKQQAKSDKAQRKALKQQAKAAKAARKAGNIPQQAPVTTPQ